MSSIMKGKQERPAMMSTGGQAAHKPFSFSFKRTPKRMPGRLGLIAMKRNAARMREEAARKAGGFARAV